jgi:hypothetical protein
VLGEELLHCPHRHAAKLSRHYRLRPAHCTFVGTTHRPHMMGSTLLCSAQLTTSEMELGSPVDIRYSFQAFVIGRCTAETGWNTTRTLGSRCHNRNARQSKTSELACLRRIYLAASGLPATLCVFYRMLTCLVGEPGTALHCCRPVLESPHQHNALFTAAATQLAPCVVICCTHAVAAAPTLPAAAGLPPHSPSAACR